MLNTADLRTEIAAAQHILRTITRSNPGTFHIVRIGRVDILTTTTGATRLDPARMVETATAYLHTNGRVYVTLGNGQNLRPTRRDLPKGAQDGDVLLSEDPGCLSGALKGASPATLIKWVRAAAKADCALAAVHAAA